jgi:hypothetical protein
MGTKNKKETTEDLPNVVSIDKAKINRLKQRGHLGTMLEEFEILRLKLLYDQNMDKQEAMKLVTLTKYFIDNGPTEAFRLSCKLMYEKYMKPFGL